MPNPAYPEWIGETTGNPNSPEYNGPEVQIETVLVKRLIQGICEYCSDKFLLPAVPEGHTADCPSCGTQFLVYDE